LQSRKKGEELMGKGKKWKKLESQGEGIEQEKGFGGKNGVRGTKGETNG